MSSVFLEIIFDAADFAKMTIEGRDEIEEPLNGALVEMELGEVTGGGAGSGVVIIDAEIENEQNLEKGLVIIRQILREMGCSKNTIIKRAKPSVEIYALYD